MTRNRARLGVTRTAALAALTLGGLIVAGATPAAAAASHRNDTVSVSGHGSVKATPDTLISDLDVHAKRDSAQAALDAVSQAATDVINALEANGVDSSDIQTYGLSVGQNYDNKGKPDGYRADENITARMHPLDTAGKALDAAAQAGGNNLTIQDSTLVVSKKAKYEAMARTKAFNDAKAAAEQYAELAGRKLGRVEQIRAVSRSSRVEHVGMSDTAAGGAAAPAPSQQIPVSPGKQTISTSVHVVWALK